MQNIKKQIVFREDRSVSWVKGIRAAGIAAGIKASGARDLCIVCSETPAAAAAVFTTNAVKAAPVLLDMQHIEGGAIRAFVVNSGNANACTGAAGYIDAQEMAGATASLLGIEPTSVLVCSTGVIGVRLPMDKVRTGIGTCAKALVHCGDDRAAEAIMTTDLAPKTVFAEIELSGKTVSVAGFAKGSGMIHPNMATMLGFVVTDAAITAGMLKKMHDDSVRDSYNMISVDGDTSTNDTALILANGCAGNRLIDCENEDYALLKAAVDEISMRLARMIAADGEGATKLVEVDLKGAKTDQDARIMARSVISSNLVKTAMHGADANWGRVLCAMGYSGAAMTPEGASVAFESSGGTIDVFKDGAPVAFDEDLAERILSAAEVVIRITLMDGEGAARAWGCDLSAKYVEINGSYRS